MVCGICGSSDAGQNQVYAIKYFPNLGYLYLKPSHTRSNLYICSNCIDMMSNELAQLRNGQLVVGIHEKEIKERDVNKIFVPVEDVKPDDAGWSVVERHGWEIYDKEVCDKAGLTMLQMLDERHWPRDEREEPLYHKPLKGNLKEGQQVIAKMNPFDFVHDIATVKKDDGLGLHLDSGGCVSPLEWSEDERECWVTSGVIMKAALAKVKIGL